VLLLGREDGKAPEGPGKGEALNVDFLLVLFPGSKMQIAKVNVDVNM